MRDADLVLDAFASQRLIGLLSDRDPSLDQDRAYAIAREVHQRRLERGEKPVGRKIGFTNRAIWSEWGLDAPIWGYMYDSTVQYAGAGRAQVGIGHLIQPRIEPEIQLHFACTPPSLAMRPRSWSALTGSRTASRSCSARSRTGTSGSWTRSPPTRYTACS
jgi:2-keto-4-pentenoate hydratase